jgi:integrase
MAAIRERNGILYIDFRHQCRRHVLSTGLRDTKPNRQLVNLKCKAVEYDIKLNKLDIKKYFPQFIEKESAGIITLADFFEYYKKELSIRPSSWKNLLWAWDYYINPYLGNHKLADIDRHECLVFRNFVNEKISAVSTNLVITHLACILTRAHDEGRIPLYPLRKIGKLESNSEPIDPFSFDELTHLLKFLSDGGYPEADMIFIWSRCGLRHGEILGLKWEDLDYYNSQLSIKRTLHTNGTEGLPKTKGSMRTLTLRPTVIEAFKRQEKRSRLVCDYIFPNPTTKQRYSYLSVFWQRFKVLLTLSELKFRSPNQLRHTFATLHIAAGENITWVSRMLGHANVTTTLERYNKFVPNLTRDDGSAFESQIDKIIKVDSVREKVAKNR